MSACPTPGKMVFDSRAAARAAARWTSKKPYVSNGTLRPYRCTCGYWHLTHLAGKARQLDRRRRRKNARGSA